MQSLSGCSGAVQATPALSDVIRSVGGEIIVSFLVFPGKKIERTVDRHACNGTSRGGIRDIRKRTSESIMKVVEPRINQT